MPIECEKCHSKNLRYVRASSIKCNEMKFVCMDCGFEF